MAEQELTVQQMTQSAIRQQQLKRFGQMAHVATARYMNMTYAQLKGMADNGLHDINDAEQMGFYLALKRKAVQLLANKRNLYEQSTYRVQQGSSMPGDHMIINRWPTWQANLEQVIAASQMNFQHYEQGLYGETFSLGGWNQ